MSMDESHDVHVESPATSSPDGSSSAGDVASQGARQENVVQDSEKPAEQPKFPPPKTDKPRPHVCTTCERSFARLEHLKRHERSHTKEKPFACPECARCFARRDLLLRHQQKLHANTTPSARPRNGRRESVSTTATAGSRVRKSSTANAAMRPRASTFSQGDRRDASLLAAVNAATPRPGHPLRSHHNSISAFPGGSGFDYRGIPGHHPMQVHNLPRIDTSSLPMDMSGGLRTAPVFGGFPPEYTMNEFSFGQGSTINPAQLHFGDGNIGMDSPYQQLFPGMSASQMMMDEENNFDWMNGFESTLTFGNNESAIDGSSPSAMSTQTPEGMTENMMEATNLHIPHTSATGVTSMWASSFGNQMPMVSTPQAMDFSQAGLSGMIPASAEMLSPRTLLAQSQAGDHNFSPVPQLPFSMGSPLNFQHLIGTNFDLPMNTNGDTPTTSSESMGSSLRHSSVTSVSTDSINDSTRKVLLQSLSRMPGFGERRQSYPASKSPSAMSRSFTTGSFPSAHDLQRYISAYIHYFHPHLPFLHIPTLNFDSSTYRTIIKLPDGQTQRGPSGVGGGGGCLILAMAAIGALYEYEHSDSKELFEASKKLLGGYLEARRRKTMSRAQYNQPESDGTPLWLVQAMLLNVIYGHNCGDKTSADIASTHCAALVSLARAAELARPDAMHHEDEVNRDEESFEDAEWLEWKRAEERKRTLYTVFVLSSLLVSAYNHSPALTNSEIRLDLPCDESLWEAESNLKWNSLGGTSAAQTNGVSFAYALSHLLTASQRQPSQGHLVPQPFGSGMKAENIPPSELKPSAFGCLILINALHNYIWETRQRHMGPTWTKEETDQMHAHIEPALRAWQAAWASNPAHSPERPNPYGLGPVAADCVPLLDLAYVRLFVNLGRSKEAFWQRDWDAMANELASGTDILQHAEPDGDGSAHEDKPGSGLLQAPLPLIEPEDEIEMSLSDLPEGQNFNNSQQTGHISRRERLLRKAAFYAADSLLHSDRLGISLAEHTSRELPIQSALCTFDCAQVLAEWIATVQERVGRYVGIIGKDEIDFSQVPAMMLLEDEDVRLIEKMDEVFKSAEVKMMGTGLPVQGLQARDSAIGNTGYGSKILTITAHMLDRSAIWPVTKLMARCLETQISHMNNRAHRSISGAI